MEAAGPVMRSEIGEAPRLDSAPALTETLDPQGNEHSK